MDHNHIFQGMSLNARETKEKYTIETISKEKASSQQRKQSTKQKGSLLNGRRYLQMAYPIRG